MLILTTCCSQVWNEYNMDRFIGLESAEFKELSGQIEQARHDIQDVRDKYRPALTDKRYLSGEEVMEYLHVSPRTLQNLRDNRIIGYTTICGKILYPEDALETVLHQNYRLPELPFWYADSEGEGVKLLTHTKETSVPWYCYLGRLFWFVDMRHRRVGRFVAGAYQQFRKE